jgi:hypothetical protein
MSRILERLLLWVADVLDRNLITVPEIDDEWPPSARPWDDHRAREVLQRSDIQS